MNIEKEDPVYLVFKYSKFEMTNPYNGQPMEFPSGYYVVPYPMRNDKIILIGTVEEVSKIANILSYFSVN
jgi:hypothetical protein